MSIVYHAPPPLVPTVVQAHSHLPLSHPISQTPIEVSFFFNQLHFDFVARYKDIEGENLYSVLSCVQIQEAIKGLDTWDFDIISMERISKHRYGSHTCPCTVLITVYLQLFG